LHWLFPFSEMLPSLPCHHSMAPPCHSNFT
jgi:hypothetical protein